VILVCICIWPMRKVKPSQPRPQVEPGQPESKVESGQSKPKIEVEFGQTEPTWDKGRDKST